MDTQYRNFFKNKGVEKIIEKTDMNMQDDGDIRRVEIIVLKYKSPDMEKDCVSRIVEYTKWPYKLNIFDNRGNGPNTAKAWNKLIRESTCDYILFIDSDAFVQGELLVHDIPKKVCWLTEMMKAFDMHDNVAIVGPVCGTPATSTIQWMRPSDTEPYSIDGHLSGYCFLTKKSIYEDTGYFDEDFCFYGQESDWIERVMEANIYDGKKYKIVIAPRAHVVHGYDNSASIAAKEAEQVGELNPVMDAEYSYFCWNEKKRIRLMHRGIPYKYDRMDWNVR